MSGLSPYIVVVIIAWVVAQGSKYLLHALKTRNLTSYQQLYLSGNMPSSHSAITVALATLIGFTEGTDTAVFALAALFAAVVMYDAVMVRRSSGEQGTAIMSLIEELKSKINLPRAAKGHEPLEVAVGAILGFAIGLGAFSIIGQ